MGEYFAAELEFGPARHAQARRAAELAGVPGPDEPADERGCRPAGPSGCWRIHDYRASYGLGQFEAARRYLRRAGIAYSGRDDGWVEADGVAVDWRPGMGPGGERERSCLPVGGPCLSQAEWRAITERAERLADLDGWAAFCAGQVADHFQERHAADRNDAPTTNPQRAGDARTADG